MNTMWDWIDKKVADEHLLFDSARSRGITNSSLLESDLKVTKKSCHAILKNLYEPKMDVILTI